MEQQMNSDIKLGAEVVAPIPIVDCKPFKTLLVTPTPIQCANSNDDTKKPDSEIFKVPYPVPPKRSKSRSYKYKSNLPNNTFIKPGFAKKSNGRLKNKQNTAHLSFLKHLRQLTSSGDITAAVNNSVKPPCSKEIPDLDGRLPPLVEECKNNKEYHSKKCLASRKLGKKPNKVLKKQRRKKIEIPAANILFQKILLNDMQACMGPKYFRLAKDRHFIRKCANVQLKHMDPLSFYGIRLHRYANDMCDMIRVAKLAIDSNLIPPANAAPKMPKFDMKLKHTTNSLNFMPKELTSFSMGVGNTLPELSECVTREILYQSVSAVVGLLGFETTHQSVLDLLVDTSIEFLKKVAYRFKVAYEDHKHGWMTDFPNIAERVLIELGIGSCRGLHEFYQGRVVRYIRLLESQCESLNTFYQCLIASTPIPEESSKISEVPIKTETEEEVLEIDTALVQIALNEEVELSSLDAGFQLLNSLEEADT